MVSNIIGASVREGSPNPASTRSTPRASTHRWLLSRLHPVSERQPGTIAASLYVTADHGKMLGEDGLWGMYYIHPPSSKCR